MKVRQLSAYGISATLHSGRRCMNDPLPSCGRQGSALRLQLSLAQQGEHNNKKTKKAAKFSSAWCVWTGVMTMSSGPNAAITQILLLHCWTRRLECGRAGLLWAIGAYSTQFSRTQQGKHQYARNVAKVLLARVLASLWKAV